jgi:hypothetical protein
MDADERRCKNQPWMKMDRRAFFNPSSSMALFAESHGVLLVVVFDFVGADDRKRAAGGF